MERATNHKTGLKSISHLNIGRKTEEYFESMLHVSDDSTFDGYNTPPHYVV